MSGYAWIADLLIFLVAPVVVLVVVRARRKAEKAPALPAPWTKETPGYRPPGVPPWRPRKPR